MRWLCLDLGLKRTGVAVSSPGGCFAIPLTVLEHDADGASMDVVAALMREHRAQGLVVGLPLSMDGSASQQTRDVIALARQMARHLCAPLQLPPDVILPDTEGAGAPPVHADACSGLTVALWDERLTSWEAQRAATPPESGRRARMGKRRNLDAHAAAVILQSFLDARSGRSLCGNSNGAGTEAEGGQR